MMLDPSLDLGDGSPGVRSYEELYVEHTPAARRLALSMVSPDVADDIVAEAFARVLAAIRSGGGPSQTFRGYLLTRFATRLTTGCGPGAA
jgi:DNA-directed RNA polymerase specialized sigma24 family protein